MVAREGEGVEGCGEWPAEECSEGREGEVDMVFSRGEEPDRREAKMDEPVEKVGWCVGWCMIPAAGEDGWEAEAAEWARGRKSAGCCGAEVGDGTSILERRKELFLRADSSEGVVTVEVSVLG